MSDDKNTEMAHRPLAKAATFLLLFTTVLVAGCSQEPDTGGFAGLAQAGDGSQSEAFLQPGPGIGCIFPMTGASIRNTVLNGGI